MGYEVLLYIPNIIGYVRLILLFVSLVFFEEPWIFLVFYGTSVALDALDGILARKLNQCSQFGAWFDVLIDLASRGALWCFLSKWGCFVMLIEWLTFVCTHARGAQWKIPDEEFPTICKMVMANGFKTPAGVYAITGIFVLPLWLYSMSYGVLTLILGMSHTLQIAGAIFLIVGRGLAMTTELFFIKHHVKEMLHEDGHHRKK